jgi:hypothetical protein
MLPLRQCNEWHLTLLIMHVSVEKMNCVKTARAAVLRFLQNYRGSYSYSVGMRDDMCISHGLITIDFNERVQFRFHFLYNAFTYTGQGLQSPLSGRTLENKLSL